MRTLLGLIATLMMITNIAAANDTSSAHDFSFNSLSGEPMDMSQYAGKTVLLVNTASKCGYTPQYEGLQALWKEYESKGLVIVGVPSGDFSNQEYDDNEKIAQFCEINYGVTFPLTEKTHVIGEDAHPVYQWLKASLGEESVPGWNFHKYLIDAEGKPVAFFETKVKPRDSQIIAAIEATLGR